jgi:hypothetical protein
LRETKTYRDFTCLCSKIRFGKMYGSKPKGCGM